MSIITITQKGSFNKTERYLRKLDTSKISSILERYGGVGVEALSNATPRKTGFTAKSWYYTIEEKPGYCSIHWCNSNQENGIPVAILIQYGHGTRNGGWVEGRDYVMPAIQPIFDKILDDIMKEVIE